MDEKKIKITNKRYPFLPDAPTVISITDPQDQSPYHQSAQSKDEYYGTLFQINNMAIAFVKGYSSQAEQKLDFSTESLASVDRIINDFKYTNDEDLTVFVAMVGAYVGKVIEMVKMGTIEWHPGMPVDYYFSGLRIKGSMKTPEGTEKVGIFETNPFAQVSKRVVYVLNKSAEEPSMVEYFSFLSKDLLK